MAFHRPRGSTNFKGKKRDILEVDVERDSWLHDLPQTKTVEELISIIVSKIEAEPGYYRQINRICDHLRQIMQFFYYEQNVKILLFGSSLTGLALRESDVDIYLDFGGGLPEPPDKLVKTLKNKVRKYGYFYKSIPIFARVPIVQCVHQSQISCDISFLNALGVSNSLLIKFLVSIDNRIRPLILIMKFMMKKHGLLGQNAFTSYALIILIVFFLQVLENPIIPSINYIQSLTTNEEIVADWNTSFTTDISSLPPVNNKLSVVELIYKFFDFYSKFEFGFYIISSFTGKSYLKSVFSTPDSIPEEFYLYKENIAKNESFKFDYNKYICVQGPFNHGNNISRNITQKSLIQFQNLCWENAAIGTELLNENNSEENQKKYILTLLNSTQEESSSKKQRKDDVFIYVGDKINIGDSSWTEDNLRNEWSKNIFNSVQDILRNVIKCNIKSQSLNSDYDSLYSGDEKCINCELLYHELVSKKRFEVRDQFDFPQDMSIIKKEEMISNYLVDTGLKDAEKLHLKFDVICRVKKNPTCFVISLNSKEFEKGKSNLVQQIFHFIQNNFPKWIK